MTGLVVYCDGCGLPDATETLWLSTPIGLTCVHVHRDRACAEAAREARGGGRFVTLKLARGEFTEPTA